jgi:hypothetical protein
MQSPLTSPLDAIGLQRESWMEDWKKVVMMGATCPWQVWCVCLIAETKSSSWGKAQCAVI